MRSLVDGPPDTSGSGGAWKGGTWAGTPSMKPRWESSQARMVDDDINVAHTVRFCERGVVAWGKVRISARNNTLQPHERDDQVSAVRKTYPLGTARGGSRSHLAEKVLLVLECPVVEGCYRNPKPREVFKPHPCAICSLHQERGSKIAAVKALCTK